MRYVRLDGQVVTESAAAFSLEKAGLPAGAVAHLETVEFGRPRSDEGWEPVKKNPDRQRKKNPSTNKWNYRDAPGKGKKEKADSAADSAAGISPEHHEAMDLIEQAARLRGQGGKDVLDTMEKSAPFVKMLSDRQAIRMAEKRGGKKHLDDAENGDHPHLSQFDDRATNARTLLLHQIASAHAKELHRDHPDRKQFDAEEKRGKQAKSNRKKKTAAPAEDDRDSVIDLGVPPGGRSSKARHVEPGDLLETSHGSNQYAKVLSMERTPLGIRFLLDDGIKRPFQAHGGLTVGHDENVWTVPRGRARFCCSMALAAGMVYFGRQRDDTGWEDYGHATKLRKRNEATRKWMYKPKARKADEDGGDAPAAATADQQPPSRPSGLGRSVEMLNTAKKYAHQMGAAGRSIQLATDMLANSGVTGLEAVDLARHAGLGEFGGRQPLALERLKRHVEEDYFRGKRGEPITLHAEVADAKPQRPKKPKKKEREYDEQPPTATLTPAQQAHVDEMASRLRRAQDAALAAADEKAAQQISNEFREGLSDDDAIGLLRHVWGGEPTILSDTPKERHPSIARTSLDLRVMGKRWFSRLKGGA